MGPEATDWLSEYLRIPPKLKLHAPLSISRAHIDWSRNGRSSFSGAFLVNNGPTLAIDVLSTPEEFAINKLHIQDEASQAWMNLRVKERELHIDFEGSLDKATYDRLLAKNQLLSGWVRGDFEAHILLDRPIDSTGSGKIEGAGLGYPLRPRVPLTIDSVSLEADGDRLRVLSALLTWGESHLTLKGDMASSAEGIQLDLSITADGLDWENMEEILDRADGENQSAEPGDLESLPIRGTLSVDLGHFSYKGLTWRPFQGDVVFSPGTISVDVRNANLCGISTPGKVTVSPETIDVEVAPVSKNQDLEATLFCLGQKERLITGRFGLQGDLKAEGGQDALAGSIKGSWEFDIQEGRVYRLQGVARILSYLNLTEILVAKPPDLATEGLAYDFIEAKGTVEGGKIKIKEGAFGGPTMEVAAQGELDLISREFDLLLLVAPLKTPDRIVKRLPVARRVLGGTLISIPIRVKGPMKEPNIKMLSPKAVGAELQNIMKRTLKRPFAIINPRTREEEE
jgi:hypothetical protein